MQILARTQGKTYTHSPATRGKRGAQQLPDDRQPQTRKAVSRVGGGVGGAKFAERSPSGRTAANRDNGGTHARRKHKKDRVGGKATRAHSGRGKEEGGAEDREDGDE